jgi:glycosyltransferase involved in cell wall biosynthesis
MPSIKIGILTSSFPLTKGSNSGIFILRLVEHLPEHVDVTIIVPSGAGKPDHQAGKRYALRVFRYAPRPLQLLAHQPGGIPEALAHRRWLYLLLPIFLLSMFISCLRVARKVDVLHANWSVNGVIAGLAGWVTGKPVVTTLRGSDVNRMASSRLYRKALKYCLMLSRCVVTVSTSLANSLRRDFPGIVETELTVIPNGVDEKFISITRHPRHNSGTLHLITIGNLTHNKGIDQILHAMESLRDERVTLKVIGDGPQRMNLERLVDSLALHKYVEFCGLVPPDEIPEYLAHADVFFLGSYSEGRANVVLEAMATALPIVATDIPGNRELVTDGVTGLLFSPGDLKQLTAHLRTLAADPQRCAQMGQAGRAYILSNRLTWSETARQYTLLYSRLAGHAPTVGKQQKAI